MRTLPCQPIKVWGLKEIGRILMEPEKIISMVVTQDDKNVPGFRAKGWSNQ
jgi:hypothetical protein